MSKTLTPAVSYIRMSDPKQEGSPDQQRAELAKLAERDGYRIVREYFESGVSGAATDKRTEFQRMHHDACNGREFDVILCWDLSRFGRFDSVEAGYWIHPLRQAGVKLVTVAEGPINWEDFAGRVIYNIQTEGKHQYLRDLSRNVTRARSQAVQNGTTSPAAVYGYDRLIHDPSGKLVRRVPYGEKYVKPKGWRSKLSPAKDATAATVRWMFRTYTDGDCGIQWLVTKLNRKGTPAPRGGFWTWQTVKCILSNQIYTGRRACGHYTGGKFFEVGSDGDIVPVSGKQQRKRRPKPLVVLENDHKRLVSADTFDRAQRKIANRRLLRTAPRSDGYLLTGLLTCGHCGGRLYGGPGGGGRYRSGKPKPQYYVCITGPMTGRSHRHTYRVRQDAIEPYVLNVVEKALLTPAAADQIREAICPEGQGPWQPRGQYAVSEGQDPGR